MGKKSRRASRAKRQEQEEIAEAAGPRPRWALFIAIAGIIGGLVVWFMKDWELGAAVAVAGLIAAGAYDSFSDPPDSRAGGSSDAINFGN
jgi:4-hydroxybenzoate polyprenyltransferase